MSERVYTKISQIEKASGFLGKQSYKFVRMDKLLFRDVLLVVVKWLAFLKMRGGHYTAFITLPYKIVVCFFSLVNRHGFMASEYAFGGDLIVLFRMNAIWSGRRRQKGLERGAKGASPPPIF